jgi:hypothetical protein
MGVAAMEHESGVKTGKKVYQKPKLVVYGAVSHLTTSGTITTGENPGSMAMNMA